MIEKASHNFAQNHFICTYMNKGRAVVQRSCSTYIFNAGLWKADDCAHKRYCGISAVEKKIKEEKKGHRMTK